MITARPTTLGEAALLRFSPWLEGREWRGPPATKEKPLLFQASGAFCFCDDL